jgi:hypothetical protein
VGSKFRTLDNGQTVYAPDSTQGKESLIHERTAIGKFRDGSYYLRAANGDDSRAILKAAQEIGITPEKRRGGASHFGRIGSYDHLHVPAADQAVAILRQVAKSWDAAQRKDLKEGESKGFFAGPGESFPISGPEDVKHAWDLAGHAENPDEVRAKIKAGAKAHGWESGLPEDARDDEGPGRKMMKSYVEARLGRIEKQKAQVGGDKIALGALEMRKQELLALDSDDRTIIKSHYDVGTRTVNGKVVTVAAHDTKTPPAKTDYMDRARTIHKQLGGNRFTAMTGAKDFMASENGLQFRIPKAKDGINHVQVHLQGDDTYKVIYGRIAKKDGIPQHKVISEHEGLYADQLQSHFTNHTGLYTHL